MWQFHEAVLAYDSRGCDANEWYEAQDVETLLKRMEAHMAMPGAVQSDLVVVQSERMRMDYIDFLTEFAGEDTRAIWEEKIISQAPEAPKIYT